MYHIYGLIDPVLHVVRYIGQTTNPVARRLHCHVSGCDPATGEWVAGLSQPPGVLILESGENTRVVIGTKGKRKPRPVYARAATIAETKWMKRFRKTILNRKQRDNCKAVWDALVNPNR